MEFLLRLLLVLAFSIASITTSSAAGESAPLFVNLTTEDAHRANMGISFGKNQLELGHPLTIFLNDKGVFIGSNAYATKFREQQEMLVEIIGKGAVVLVCPTCMKHYGIKDSDLLAGLTVGNPKLTGGALFRDDTKTLTW